jgi:hypothetical protein
LSSGKASVIAQFANRGSSRNQDAALRIPRRPERTLSIGRVADAPLLIVLGLVLAAGGFAGLFAARATSWAVMTDELQVARLATSIAQTLSPIPEIHGVYYGALSQLYPLLLAPLFGLFDAPTAATASHVLNTVLLPSAGVPAFLLARTITGSRAAGYAAAALTVLTPWLVLTTTLLTENAAYPAFVWAVFLFHRTLAVPSIRNDVLAIAGLLIAFLARTQLLALAVVLPVALVLHEFCFALVRRGGRAHPRGGWRAVKGAVAAHRLLVVTYGLAVVAAGVFAFGGSLDAVVGNYAVPFNGDLLPPGLWSSAAAHLDQVVIGSGVLPFLLALAWALATFARPEQKAAHAFACLFVLLVPLLTIEVTSFDLRFTPGGFIQDRYLFYLVPLFAAGSAAMLVQRSHLALRVALLSGVTALFAWLVGLAVYDDDTISFWASPAAAFHPALDSAGNWLGLSVTSLLRIIAVLAMVAAAALLTWTRRAVAVVAITAAAFGVFEAAYVFDRFAEPAMIRQTKLAGVPRNWIDRSIPGDASVALVPSPHDSPDYWWEAEYWNKKANRVLRVERGPTFSPFPAQPVSIDFEAGLLRGPEPSRFLVVSPSETRFRLLASTVFDAGALKLVQAGRPYRLEWATKGMTADGWKRPDAPATLRFFGDGRAGERTVEVTMSSSAHAKEPLEFSLSSGSRVAAGSVDPGGARPPVSIRLCVPADDYADLVLRTTGSAQIPDGRVVAVHVDRVSARLDGPCARRR